MKQQKNRAEKETRIIDLRDFVIEGREENESGRMILEGYAAVFDSETLIGSDDYGFIETIEPTAFDKANMRDVPLKYNHSDSVPILARTKNRSLRLTVDTKGLFIHAELLDTQDAADMYKRVQAGLIDKMSFAFTVRDQVIDESEKMPKRIIKAFDRIFDVSVVDTPAYEDTSIYARSLANVETLRRHKQTEVAPRKNYYIQNLITMYGGNKK